MQLHPKRKYLIIGSIILILLLFLINLFWFRPIFIKHFFWRELLVDLRFDPQKASKVKVPLLYKSYRKKLNDPSIQSARKKHKKLITSARQIERYRDSWLSEESILSKDIMSWHLQNEIEGIPFIFHYFPYNPLKGAQNTLPSYLDTYHYIESTADADAYLERLKGFKYYFRQIEERADSSVQLGIIPTTTILKKSVSQMESFLTPEVDKNLLYESFKRKLNACEDISDKEFYLEKAYTIIEEDIYPVYNRMINYCQALYDYASDQDGLWSFPNGNAYYQFLLKHHSSLDIHPDSAHQLGIEEVNRIKKELVIELKKLGLKTDNKNLYLALRKLSQRQDLVLSNSIEGRRKYFNAFDSLVQLSQDLIAASFIRLPSSGLEVKRVPEFKQKESMNAYYEVATLDGDGNGSFYIRMDNLEENPLYGLPTLSFHEGYPGHHLQLALFLENKDLPLYQKRFLNNAYLEGWAMYAERLMYELGAYDHDALGNIGRLNAELVRAARLVTDTGIHYKKWDIQTALLFLKENTGMSDNKCRQELYRYILDPAQACSYTLGFIKLMDLRERAEKMLKEDFDLAAFHQVILNTGVLPLDILAGQVDRYIEEKLAEL